MLSFHHHRWSFIVLSINGPAKRRTFLYGDEMNGSGNGLLLSLCFRKASGYVGEIRRVICHIMIYLRWKHISLATIAENEFAENCVLDFELSCCVSPSNSWHFTFWLLLWDISCFSKQNVTVPHQSFHAKKHDLGKSFLIFQLMKTMALSCNRFII